MLVIQFRTPPYLKNAPDKNSDEYRMDCLAWWLITTKNKEQLEHYLAKQKPEGRKRINEHLLRAKAWIWLSTLSNQHIRHLLMKEKQDQESLKDHLNQLKTEYRDHLVPVSDINQESILSRVAP